MKRSGLKEHAYDLIVASNVLHATRSLARTAANCRRLLKPGGFLILSELTSDTLCGPFVVSGLPGWWLGRESDGRMYNPTVSEERWDYLLKENSFSGVDHVVRDSQYGSVYMISVTISQATDERVDFLRTPLRSLSVPGFTNKSDVVLVTCKTDRTTYETALAISSLLNSIVSAEYHDWETLGAQIITASESPEKEPDGDSLSVIKPGSAIIWMLQAPNKESSNWVTPEAELRALQTVVNYASNIMFVARGCETDDPKANMMKRIARTAMGELPHLRSLFVDIEGLNLEPAILSEMLLRIVALSRSEYDGLLWSNETKLELRQGSVLCIPRVKQDGRLHRRLASRNRVIKEILAPDIPAEITVDISGHLALRETNPSLVGGRKDKKPGMVCFTSRCSSLFTFASTRTSSPIYICIESTSNRPQQTVIAVSEANTSSCDLPEDQIISQIDLGTCPADALRHIISMILLNSFLAGISGTLWLHDAPVQFATAAMHLCRSRGIQLFLSTFGQPSEDARLLGAINFIHPRSTQRGLQVVVPSNVQILVVMGMSDYKEIISFYSNLIKSGLADNLCYLDTE
ncbi:hypothetical protein F4777DRAFT_531224 [Nemania sp. FL0916]|nr:hypothetical protein F4777DRAFT_531224 [Nemania sp. FL0916]